MNDSLHDQFLKIVDSGDEGAAESFLIAHLKEFPEDIQKKIAFAFFEKALDERAETMNDLSTLQKEALAALDDVEKAERSLTDKQKELEAKSQLSL